MFDSVGTMGEWAGAVASVAGLVLSVVALVVSKRADLASENARRALQKLELERDERQREYQALRAATLEEQNRRDEARAQREADEASRNVARAVMAWWVYDDEHCWGVLVSNDGRSAGTLHDVRIEATAKGLDKTPIRFGILPPGQFFVESVKTPFNGHSSTTGWAYPRPVRDAGAYSSVVNSSWHQVTCIQFGDPVGGRWEWSLADGLRPLD